jgi:hypothetical protein
MSITAIPKEDIACIVTEAIAGARESILATHTGSASALPVAYAALLKEKVRTVECRRIVFAEAGSAVSSEWEGLGETRGSHFVEDFQRMILIDNCTLFFGIEKQNLSIFFTTEDVEVIGRFRTYFDAQWESAQNF